MTPPLGFSIIVVALVVGGPQDPRNLADALGAKLLAEAKLPGLSIAISRNDSIVWARGFGFADLQQKRPVTPSTRFRIGSVTKLLTVAGAARLVQDGRIDLDAPVQRYVPSFPAKKGTITLNHLLGHLSGIRHYGRSEFFNSRRYTSVGEALAIFQDDSLLFSPGTRYSYSSYGYVLASVAIENACGKPFLRYMKEDVIAPLGLSSIGPDDNDTSDATQARPYSVDSLGNFFIGPYNDNSDRWAAGGFLSSAEDLARFGSLLLRDGLLNSETRRLLFTSQKTTDGRETGVGLGWRIERDSLGNEYYHHGGTSVGGRAFLLVVPRERLVVAILANLTFAAIGENEALEFARIFAN